ncbi:unnamed protein product [Hermetia illucens]|uniref:Phosphatidylserine decarboxylase proenzyme, mitochondrial n=2 Tax=Hermetia illucens TaxID=343691 RepID=A0A7R8V4R1_HERIL|nr:unnamed protein product [Hermetia illucens]
MAVYFMPKNHLITKASTLKSFPNKWTIRWATTRRNLSNKVSGTPGINTTSQQTQTSYGQHRDKKKVLDWWLLAAGWFTWSGLLTRWTPIGVCVFAALEWHYHTRKLEKQGLPITASEIQRIAYCSLPLRLVSRCWGWVASCPVPPALRPTVFGAYVNAFDVNMEEAENPELKQYRSLSEFFTRTLRNDVRVIDKASLVSPADGRVLHFGSATESRIEQVKGITYSLDAFLGPPSWTKNENCSSCADALKLNKDSALYQCVIYLAPGDYHRFHSPAKWEPEIRRHFTGQLLSVSPKIAEWLPGLFCLNERALYIGKWEYGFFSFTAVGATNVGSVQIYFDDGLKTNKYVLGPLKRKRYDERQLPEGMTLEKGDLVGQFNMGSTIVLIFEAPKNFEFTIVPGQKIKFGEKLGEVRTSKKTNAKIMDAIEDFKWQPHSVM